MELSNHQNLEAAIFRVLTDAGDTAGTAFAISDGILITCTHVITDASLGSKFYVVHHKTGKRFAASVLKRFTRSSQDEDVATLKIKKSSEYGVLEFGNYSLQRNTKLYSFGFPESKPLEGLPGLGTVTGATKESGHPVWGVESNQFTTGYSGAPAQDIASGLVVGVIVSILQPDSNGRLFNTSFIIRASTVLSVCPHAKARHPPELDGYCSSIRAQLNRSPYFLPGLPSFSIVDTFQKPEIVKIHRTSSEYLEERYNFDSFQDLVFSSKKAICIVGDAGRGKSTMLRYFAISLAKQSEDGGTAIPILIKARHLAAATGLTLSERLIDALRLDSYYSLNINLPTDFIDRWPNLTGIRFVVLIDACDELNSLRSRVQFLRYISDDLAPHLLKLGHSIVISSRDVGQLANIKGGFETFSVGSLATDAPLQIGRAVLGIEADQLQYFLERLPNRYLLESPLTVLLLLAIFRSPGDVREDRHSDVVSIYGAYVEIAIAELQDRGIDRSLSKDVTAFLLDLLKIIAYDDLMGEFSESLVIDKFTDFLLPDSSRTSAKLIR